MKDVVLLHVDTTLFSLYVKGKLQHAYRDAVNSTVEACSQLVIRGDYETAKIFSTTYNALISYTSSSCAPLFFEEQSYSILIKNKTNDDIEFYHISPQLRGAVDKVSEQAELLTGNVNFGSEVGFSELVIRVGGRDALTVCIEVFPSKMDYRSDFFDMLYEVNREIHNLAFDFLKKTYLTAQLCPAASQTLTEWYAILAAVLNRLLCAIDRISRAPHRNLVHSSQLRPISLARRADKQTQVWIRKHLHRLVECPEARALVSVDSKHLCASYLPTSRVIATSDTLENRFVKYVLDQIQYKLRTTRTRYIESCGNNPPDTALVALFNRMETRIRRYQQYDFIRDAGKLRRADAFSLVLQFGAGYQEVLRTYIMLMRGLAIDSDIFRIALKDVWLLYEYWCFLKINQLLRQKYNLITQDLIQTQGQGLVVNLKKGQPSRLSYRTTTGEIITLCYNCRPTAVFPTTAQQPDNIIALQKAGASTQFQYILDAKYKLDCRAAYIRKFGGIGPQEVDINAMHRYRDAIVAAVPATTEFERTIFGAYVLFPFADETAYRTHRFFQSIEKVNVGGLPFLPGHTQLVSEFLEWLIAMTPEDAFNRTILPRGIRAWIRRTEYVQRWQKN